MPGDQPTPLQSNLRAFWRSLCRHPGVPMAWTLTALHFGAVTLSPGSNGWPGWSLIGLAFLVSLVFPWSIILATAWSGRWRP